MQRNRQAFTLAEMMVVMLILTVILAAFAPMMTKRKTVDLGTPWRWAANNRDIYFGLADNQSVMLGQNSKNDNENAKLIINQPNNNQRSVLFKGSDEPHAQLYLPGRGNFLFGTGFADAPGANPLIPGGGRDYTENTAFGSGAFGANTTGMQNTAVGSNSLQRNTTGSRNAAVGSIALNSNTIGNENVALGYSALAMNQEGDFNVAIGSQALSSSADSSNNVVIGYNALSNFNGIVNNSVAVGSSALLNLAEDFVGASTVSDSIGIGFQAGAALGAGSEPDPVNTETIRGRNISIGSDAFATSTMGSKNVAIGHQALRDAVTSYGNTAIGFLAMSKTTTTNNEDATSNDFGANVAVGERALLEQTTGSANVAVGAHALRTLTDKSKNTAVGYGALRAAQRPENSTAIGYNALMSGTLPSSTTAGSLQKGNTAVGASSLLSSTTGSYNTAIGQSALRRNTTGYYNVAIGMDAIGSTMTGSGNNTGHSNIAIGYKTLFSNTSGSNNIAIGGNGAETDVSQAGQGIEHTLSTLYSNTTGSNNIAIGQLALNFNTSGSKNIALGQEALLNNLSGSNNIAIGYGALGASKGSSNIAIGKGACSKLTESGNSNVTCIGNNSGPASPYVINGSTPTNTKRTHEFWIGDPSSVINIDSSQDGLLHVNSDSKTIVLGKNKSTIVDGDTTIYSTNLKNLTFSGINSTLHFGATNINTDGSYIQIRTKPYSTTGLVTNPAKFGINIGGDTATVKIGKYYILCNGSWMTDPANPPQSCNGYNISPSEPGQLVSYTTETQLAYTLSDMRKKNIKSEYKSGLEQIRQMMPKNFVYKDDEHKINRVGLIAQDLEKIMPEAVKKDKDGFLRVSNEHIKYALVNAVKQLDTLVQNIVTQVKELADKILCIDKRVKELEKENKELKQQIDKINKRLEKLENDD